LIKNVQVIINPAAGHNDPVLNVLNDVFRGAGVTWDAFITHEAGDGTRLAQKALDAGADAIAVYGGDGTVREVAGVLQGGDVPLAILPGGTGNLTAVELGIPRLIRRAARMIFSENVIREVDVGMAGDEPFLVATGSGTIARVMKEADRDLKTRLGKSAYFLTGIRELVRPERTHYRLTLDDQLVVEKEGIAVLVANSGSVGISGMSMPFGAELSDGLLHVMLFPDANFPTVRKTAMEVVGMGELTVKELPRWTAKRVKIESDKPQALTADGDIIQNTPVEICINHKNLKILLPVRPRIGTGTGNK
jgi:YegS/Rv2252/BmrU family lipid kinase